jgi:hypothetical protein
MGDKVCRACGSEFHSEEELKEHAEEEHKD